MYLAIQFLGTLGCWRNSNVVKRELEMEVSAMGWMMVMIFTCARGLEQ